MTPPNTTTHHRRLTGGPCSDKQASTEPQPALSRFVQSDSDPLCAPRARNAM